MILQTYEYPCNDSTSCHPIKIFLTPGLYKLEAYGASGGSTKNTNNPHEGGKGGYSSGLYRLTKPIFLFIYLGGEGQWEYSPKNATNVGGWNGGGNGTTNPSGGGGGAGGGGSTDIRLKEGNFDDPTSLKSRIIVAGGGGGSYQGSSCYSIGGSGGGNEGTATTKLFQCNEDNDLPCYGTQSGCLNGDESSEEGREGVGASLNKMLASGGGGGYWGGGSAIRGSGGGSGYTGNLLNPKSQTGVHTGNGKVIISFISSITCRANRYFSKNLFFLFFIFTTK